MNFSTLIHALADPGFSGRLCLTLAHSLWQLAALAAAAWCYERITRRRSVERCYAAYVAALAIGLAGAGVTFALVESPVEALAVAASPIADSAPTIVDSEAKELAPLATGVAPTTVTGIAADHDVGALASPADAGTRVAALWLKIAPWATAVYLGGVALMLARLARGMWSTQRLTGRARIVADGPLVAMLHALARQWSLRVAPRLAEAEHIVVPKVVGLVRPIILLPAAALAGLPHDELELILAHELAHVRRHDLWVNLLQRLAEAALFFNPALWLVSRRISALREYCCDESVVSRTSNSGWHAQGPPQGVVLQYEHPPLQPRPSRTPGAPPESGDERTRYAWALLHIAELARGAKIAAYAELTALAASGRSPSELRRRVAHLFGEPLSEPVRLTRGGALTLVALAALLAAPVAWPSREDEAAAQDRGSEEASTGDAAAEAQVSINVVVARHVMLLEGREIIAWDELDKKIAALPNPSLAHPSFYVTRGAREAGLEDAADAEIWKLHQKHQLQGHSEGSLWTQADFRYDHIENAADLKPDESLRIERTIVDKDGQPVAGAEVVLITPIDESIPYKTWHVTLVQGRLRNRLENVLDDSNAAGRVALYPPKDEPYYLIALHPDAGFAMVGSNDAGFNEQREIKLMPWAGLVSRLAEEPGEDQEASLDTKLPARDGFPEIEFDQYWSEQKNDLPEGFFGFTHVPPIFQTALSRSFQESDGGSVGVPGASVSLLPGEIRRLDLGPLTEEQRKLLEAVREQFRQRREGADAAEPPAEDQGAADADDEVGDLTGQDAIDAFHERFLVTQVTTELERRQLGNHDEPATDASACVFVDGREFTEDAAISATSRHFALLAAWLEEQAKIDNRLVIFKTIDRAGGDEAFDVVRDRSEALSKICAELGRKAGYRDVKTSQTYGVDLKQRVDEAQAAVERQAADGAQPAPSKNSSAGNDRLRVYAVRTHLEHVLVDADCVVDVRPVLRETAGNRFPDDFVEELTELLPQVDLDARHSLMLDIHYLETVQPVIEAWINNRLTREAFAEQFGFEDCHLQMSQTDGLNEPPPPHRAGEPFELAVLGQDGKAIAGAAVEIRATPLPTAEQVTRGTFVRQSEYATVTTADEAGRLTVAVPESFTMFIKPPGFGPYMADWKNGAPARFTAELEPGWSVGGIVVDEQGRPVDGATVGLSIEFKKRPGDGQQMGVGAEAKTDAAGAWRYDSVPASMNDVSVETTHPQFMPSSRSLARGDFGIEASFAPSATIEIQQGLTVEGVVTDDAGTPITGALVRTKFLNDVREARTGDDGRYQLVGCPEAMARVVASAAGRAMDMQQVRVDAAMEPVNFQLKPGGTIRVRVLDAAGAPAPKARIFFQRWRGQINYFEFDHVDDYADENGVWVWNEAPRDEVQADICPPNGMQLTYQQLIAREEEYVIRTSPKLVVSGLVTDAETGQPVENFRATMGIVSRPDHISWERREARVGEAGRYQVEQNRSYPSHLVRIEADGYQSATSRELKSDEGEVTIDFKLERAAAVEGTLLTAAGKPAAGAKLAIGVPDSQINVQNGDIDDGSTYAARVVADDAGRFRFPAQDGPYHLVITHRDGFAYFKAAEQEIPETITLTPWARVEGTFRVGAQPIGEVEINLNSESLIHSYGRGQPSIFVHHEATANADGRFVFERVYPGNGRIGRNILLVMGDGAREVTSSNMEPIQLVAGETTQFELGGRGRPVVGTLVPPKGFADKVLWSFAEVELHPRVAEAPPADPNDPLAAQKRAEFARGQERRMDGLSYFNATVDREGEFRIDDVPAGDYTLSVSFFENPAGRLRDYRVTAPPMEGERSDEPLDLGDVQLMP